MITDESLRIVKATAPLVKENAVAITSTFYPKLLGRNPELYNYFNETNQKKSTQADSSGIPLSAQCPGFALARNKDNEDEKINGNTQTKALADAIIAYAMNIENLGNLSGLVSRMCHKHAALGIEPQHYQLVHDNLMEAIGEVLGDAVTPSVAAAWSEAVMALADICISTESDLYQQAAKLQWKGTREFVVSKVIPEAADIVSLRLEARDGKGTCPFLPGQYITVFEKPPGKKYFAPRHYTVTSQPGDAYYQITVKHVQGEDGHTGAMSTYLHDKSVGDTVLLGPVFGPCPLHEFASQDRTAVFVSAGVGITTTVAMLPQAKTLYKDVVVFHADTSPETMAFRDHLQDALVGDHDAGSAALDLSFSDNDAPRVPFQSEGKLDTAKIVDKLKNMNVSFPDGAEFFICAGSTTTPLVYKGLGACGVTPERLHMEYFGPFVTVELDD